MLTRYLTAAMRRASYELLSDGQYYGEIPGLEGVWATSGTLELCREELADVLEGWVILGLSLRHALPAIDGFTIEAPAVA